jgi:hypothetical protein
LGEAQLISAFQDGRTAAEGKLGVATEGSKGVVIEVGLSYGWLVVSYVASAE